MSIRDTILMWEFSDHSEESLQHWQSQVRPGGLLNFRRLHLLSSQIMILVRIILSLTVCSRDRTLAVLPQSNLAYNLVHKTVSDSKYLVLRQQVSRPPCSKDFVYQIVNISSSDSKYHVHQVVKISCTR